MIRSKIVRLDDGYSLLRINERLCLCYRALKKPGKGGRMDRLQCAYFGFNEQAQAEKFARYLKDRFLPFAPRLVIRESDRLPDSAWEVKVWEFDHLLNVVHECAAISQQQAATAA